MKMQSNIIKTLAQQLDIPDDHIYTPESLRLDSKKYADQAYHIYTSLVDLAPDYIIVIAYGKIIPQHILDIPRIAPINIHGSLLPRYRGASPIQSVFLDHETHTGITIMRMVAELDAGDMIRSSAFPIDFHRTVKNVIAKMIEI
jgi:methionyl-tRNA formyltransferase